MYKQKLKLDQDKTSFDIRVKRDVDRFELQNFIGDKFNKDIFPEKVEAYGAKFGPSYSTQMFRVELAIPVEWVTEESEIHFLWNGSCEASLFNPKTGKHL